ncbi:RNA methyltransferase, partial [Lactiplantibacillus plantarum]
NPYEYRNKAQFQVRLIDGHVAAGLYKENSHDLVDLPTCSVQMPATMTVMRQVVAWLEELQVPIYDEEHNSGIVKTIVVHRTMIGADNSRMKKCKRPLTSASVFH